MRLLVFAFVLSLAILPSPAQYPETGGDSDSTGSSTAPRARPLSDPGAAQAGAAQDAEDSRQKLLKSADQIDAIETNFEATKNSLDALKTQLAQLQTDNTSLKAEVSTLQDTVTHQQAAMDEMKAARMRDRQAIIDEVSTLVASKPVHHKAVADADSPTDTDPTPPPVTHHHDAAASPSTQLDAALNPPPDAPSGPVHNLPASSLAADKSDAVASTDAKPPTSSATPRRGKGYYHVVAPHETLSLICDAYRDHGVKVTVAEIRHANGLGSKSELKVGQKLFIPKSGA